MLSFTLLPKQNNPFYGTLISLIKVVDTQQTTDRYSRLDACCNDEVREALHSFQLKRHSHPECGAIHLQREGVGVCTCVIVLLTMPTVFFDYASVNFLFKAC